MRREPKIELCSNSKGPQRWWYHVKAANGEILVVSEKFSSRAMAVKGFKALINAIRLMTKTP